MPQISSVRAKAGQRVGAVTAGERAKPAIPCSIPPVPGVHR
jgi:hypothetical protein